MSVYCFKQNLDACSVILGIARAAQTNDSLRRPRRAVRSRLSRILYIAMRRLIGICRPPTDRLATTSCSSFWPLFFVLWRVSLPFLCPRAGFKIQAHNSEIKMTAFNVAKQKIQLTKINKHILSQSLMKLISLKSVMKFVQAATLLFTLN